MTATLVEAGCRYDFAPVRVEPADDVAREVAEMLARPAVAAILARAAVLTAHEREALGKTWVATAEAYRIDQIRAAGRISEALGDRRRAMAAARAQVWNAVRCNDRAWAAAAVSDAVFVELAGGLMNDDEQDLFAGPWRATLERTSA
jgi:hypothetical protein